MRKIIKRVAAATLATTVAAGPTGCGSATPERRTIRASHAQLETHPEHIGPPALKEHVEERLGDKYKVQIFPNEILGSAQKVTEPTQAGAIGFVVAGTVSPETFTGIYGIFSIPYLSGSEDVYKSVMQDTGHMEKVYEPTDEAGFRVVTWYNAGVRNFHAKTSIHTPNDLKGKKVRVQQNPASVAMVNTFGVAVVSMGSGEVCMAIQQGVIDDMENNELAPINNKHGEAAKYYAYNRYQMMSDMLVVNLKLLSGSSPGEYWIPKDVAALPTEVELKERGKSIGTAKDVVQNKIGVESIDVDVDALKQKVLPLHETMLNDNPKTVDLYNHIQEINKKAKGGKQDGDSA